ncbi:heat shock protein 23 [Aethina tumida]|uniref:heat shock protein 23 n=1 Tax=Aethina tumida TaxID=116153 RepID=UPI00096AE5A8|nr:heat shock protein 23 [Aethina tumida]
MSYFYEPYNGFQKRSEFFQSNMSQNMHNFMSPFVTSKPQVNVKEAFEVSVDVQQFAPHELSVKVTDENVVTVEGKHGEKRDQHGTISRHFVRKYDIPQGYDTTKIESRLSSDGILTILVGKFVKEKRDFTVPIKQTFQPKKTTFQPESPAPKVDVNSNHQTVVDEQKIADSPRIMEEKFRKPNERLIRVQMEQTPERDAKTNGNQTAL